MIASANPLVASVAYVAPSAAGAWPELPDRCVYHGLAGDIVRTIEPHSEADPLAILGQTLVAFGNAVGRGPYYEVEADQHHTKLFLLLNGLTSKGRKGVRQ